MDKGFEVWNNQKGSLSRYLKYIHDDDFTLQFGYFSEIYHTYAVAMNTTAGLDALTPDA